MIVLRIFIDILFLIGGFFALAGVIGMLRMPDAYCRMQSSTNTSTLGSICILLGVSLYGFFFLNSTAIGIKSLVIALFIIFTNPVSSYAIARAAKRIRVDMLNTSGSDEHGRDEVQ